MFIRKFFKLSLPLKNLTLPSQNVFAYHLSHVENLKGPRDLHETLEDNDDKLTSELKSSSLSKILFTLNNNKEAVQGSHMVTAMSVFYYTMRKKASTFSNNHTELMNIDWKDHTFYKELSYIIKPNINKLSGSEAVQILYYIKKMKGAFDIQSNLIEHLIKNLRDLSIEDFRTVLSLFKNSEKNKYLENLEKALMKNFILRVSMNHQKDNIDYLANGMYILICNSSAVCKLLDLFVEDLCNYENDIPLDKAFLIHESLCYSHYFPKRWVELLKKIQDSIIKNLNDVQPVQINYIVYAITSRVKPHNGVEELYDAEFIDKLIQKLVHEDAGFENALSALRCLTDIKHYNVEILNYVCASYFEKTVLQDVHITNHKGKLLVILSGLAHANYKSVLWKEVENYILTEQSILNYDLQTLCVLSLNAICLDCYPIEILKKIFNSAHNFSEGNFIKWTFCKIYQKIQTNPLYKGPRPTELQIESTNRFFEKIYRSRKSFPMLTHLEEGMGSAVYVKTNLATKLFHLIDHVVAFDKDDLPVPLNSDINLSEKTNYIEYLEDLKVPPQSKIVAVIFTPLTWYFRNTKTLMGPYNIFKDTLEKMNYNVVDINMSTWSQIPDKEKQSFLLSKIKEKLQTSIIT